MSRYEYENSSKSRKFEYRNSSKIDQDSNVLFLDLLVPPAIETLVIMRASYPHYTEERPRKILNMTHKQKN